jgi:hypothetical protein
MSYDFTISQGDLKIGPDGDLDKVENTAKLIQDILKIAITPLGSNVLYPWYGSPVAQTLVGNVFDSEFISTIATGQLTNAIDALRNLQQEQSKSQRVTPFEQIAALRNISIERNQVDPRFFSVRINVLTKALSQVSTSFSVTPSRAAI